MSRKTDLDKLLNMQEGHTVYVNWHEESGGEVVKTSDSFILFSVPLYGGESRFENHYSLDSANALLDEVYSWT